MSDTVAYVVKADMACDIGKHLKATHGHDLNGVVYDARIPAAGNQWGHLCQNCFDKYGAGLGIGKGQKFEKKPGSDRWIRVAGG